jgi:hypothetical protein
MKTEDDKFDLELENALGDFAKTKAVLEKRIQLYKRLLKEGSLSDVTSLAFILCQVMSFFTHYMTKASFSYFCSCNSILYVYH